MVEAGVLPDRVTTGWRLTDGEPYLMPHTDKVVVFEDYFWRGLGFPVHPFLRDLLEFWGVSVQSASQHHLAHLHFYQFL